MQTLIYEDSLIINFELRYGKYKKGSIKVS